MQLCTSRHSAVHNPLRQGLLELAQPSITVVKTHLQNAGTRCCMYWCSASSPSTSSVRSRRAALSLGSCCQEPTSASSGCMERENWPCARAHSHAEGERAGPVIA